MKNMMDMMKQVQQLQSKVQAMQDELARLEVDGEAGAGLVVVTLNGKGEMLRVRIDRSLMQPDETEILEDLVLAAHKAAKAKAESAMQEKMKAATGGLPIPPGLKLF